MRVTAPALAILILTSSASAQDLTIVSRMTTSNGTTETTTSYISSDHIRATQSDTSEMIFDLKSGNLTMPEQQKRMQEMMGGMFAMTVEKAGTTRTIAGYKCENWIVTIEQISRQEQCLTTDLKLPDAAWAGYKRYGDAMKSMMSAMGPMAGNFDKMREQMEKLKGLPLATTSTTTIMGREMKSTSEVTSITRGPIPASAWEIPAGYTRVDNPIMKAMRK